MSTKISNNSFLAFFYNSPVKTIHQKTFKYFRENWHGNHMGWEDIRKNNVVSREIEKKCKEAFNNSVLQDSKDSKFEKNTPPLEAYLDKIRSALQDSKFEKDILDLKAFLDKIETITKEFEKRIIGFEKQPLSTQRIKKRSFRTFWDFMNATGNCLCYPISKILEIFYCNLNFEKPTYKIDVRKEEDHKTFSDGKQKTESIKECIYSKSIKLKPDITIKKPSKINAKKAFILIACVIATIAIPILIGLGIVLKLIAQKKDAIIKKDYETLKTFFKPKDRNISTGAFDGPISEQKHLENAFKYQNLKNTIIGTLTIKAEHSKGFCIASDSTRKTADINDLFVKNLVLIIENLKEEGEINKHHFKTFKSISGKRTVEGGTTFIIKYEKR